MIGRATFVGTVGSLQVHVGNYVSHRLSSLAHSHPLLPSICDFQQALLSLQLQAKSKDMGSGSHVVIVVLSVHKKQVRHNLCYAHPEGGIGYNRFHSIILVRNSGGMVCPSCDLHIAQHHQPSVYAIRRENNSTSFPSVWIGRRPGDGCRGSNTTSKEGMIAVHSARNLTHRRGNEDVGNPPLFQEIGRLQRILLVVHMSSLQRRKSSAPGEGLTAPRIP
jgi:hypothetical protein